MFPGGQGQAKKITYAPLVPGYKHFVVRGILLEGKTKLAHRVTLLTVNQTYLVALLMAMSREIILVEAVHVIQLVIPQI